MGHYDPHLPRDERPVDHVKLTRDYTVNSLVWKLNAVNLLKDLVKRRIFRNYTHGHIPPVILKETFADSYLAWITVFVIMGFAGGFLNIRAIFVMSKLRLTRTIFYFYLSVISVAHVGLCAIVYPVTLLIMLSDVWIFGAYGCTFVPIMQIMPQYFVMESFVLLSCERYLQFRHPERLRWPTSGAVLIMLVSSSVVIFPVMMHLHYFDLSKISKALEGAALCLFDSGPGDLEYLRVLFVILYVLPLCAIASLSVRLDYELERRESVCRSGYCGHRNEETRDLNDFGPNLATIRIERRHQRYLYGIIVFFGLSWLPFELLSISNPLIRETPGNESNVNKVYMFFTLLVFLNSIIHPYLVLSVISRSCGVNYTYVNWQWLRAKVQKHMPHSVTTESMRELLHLNRS